MDCATTIARWCSIRPSRPVPRAIYSGGRSPETRLEEAAGLARAIDLNVVAAGGHPHQRAEAATLIGSGGVERLAALIAEQEIAVVVMDTSISPIQQRNLETAWEDQGDRPHRPDPGNLRRAGADEGRPASGGIGRTQLSAQPPGPILDPSRAAARRLRLSRRPRREPAGNGPPSDRRADHPQQARSRRREAHPRPASPRAAARAVSGGGPGRLHQRRQVHVVSTGSRDRACSRRTCCSRRSIRPCAGSPCRTAARSSFPTRSASSPTFRPSWSPLSAPPWKR